MRGEYECTSANPLLFFSLKSYLMHYVFSLSIFFNSGYEHYDAGGGVFIERVRFVNCKTNALRKAAAHSSMYYLFCVCVCVYMLCEGLIIISPHLLRHWLRCLYGCVYIQQSRANVRNVCTSASPQFRKQTH